jgi:hypothetical protein
MLFKRLWSNHRGYAVLWNNRLQTESDIILRSGIEASGPDCHGTIYLDDGHSMKFASGDYLRQVIRCSIDEHTGIVITFEPGQGRYRPWWDRIAITVHNRLRPARVQAAKGLLQSRYDASGATVDFEIPDAPAGGSVRLEILSPLPQSRG